MFDSQFSSLSPLQAIQFLQSGRDTTAPDPAAARRALDPRQHPVNNPLLRRDKRVSTSEGLYTEPVARIALPLQQLIIKRSVAFLFGKPVRYEYTKDTQEHEQAFAILENILAQAKENSLNRRLARAVFSYGECAELWHALPLATPSLAYGIPCAFKLRCSLFSPAFGDSLYPFFDAVGDMVAFSRAYTADDPSSSLHGKAAYFETYTADFHYLWKNTLGDWTLEEGYPVANPIGKIPVVYAHQPQRETQIVDPLIER